MNFKLQITKEQINKALMLVKVGLEKYLWLQENFSTRDVSSSREYQKKFNGFYRIRRNVEWQKKFYKLFEDSKFKKPSFGTIFKNLYEDTGRVEASFSSKLVATMDPNKPVVDKFILQIFELKLPLSYEKNRIEKTIKIYDILDKEIKNFINLEIGQYLIKKFKKMYFKILISDTKMVDLVLWKIR